MGETKSKRENDFLTRMVSVFSIVLFILIVSVKAAFLFDIVPRIIAVAGCVGLSIIIFLYFKYDKVRSAVYSFLSIGAGLSYKKKVLILFLISLFTKLSAILIFRIVSIDDNSDIHVYVTTSGELAENGIARTYAGYCYTFSHMYWFAVFLLPITKIFGISQIVYSCYFAVLLTVSTVLLFDTVNANLSDSDGAACFFPFVIFSILPSQILLSQYITHETAFLLFLSFSIWLYFKCFKRCKNFIFKISLMAMIFVNLLFCSAVNGMGLIAVIAFIILFGVEFIRNKEMKTLLTSLIKTVCLIVVIVIGTMLLNKVQIDHSDIDLDRVYDDKIQWTLYVGSNYDSGGHWYKDTKWDEYPQTYDEDEVKEYHYLLQKERYRELISSPMKAVTLLKNKMKDMWAVFTYPVGYTNETIPNQTMQFIYNKYLFKPFILIDYTVYLLFSIIGLYSVWFSRTKKQSLLCVFMKLFLLGATALLLITEVNNKYTISMVSIFIALVVLMMERNDQINNK